MENSSHVLKQDRDADLDEVVSQYMDKIQEEQKDEAGLPQMEKRIRVERAKAAARKMSGKVGFKERVDSLIMRAKKSKPAFNQLLELSKTTEFKLLMEDDPTLIHKLGRLQTINSGAKKFRF